MDTTITREQALAIIAEHGGYGRVRVYGLDAEGRRAYAIKSATMLESTPAVALVAVGNDGGVPIRRA